MLDKYNIKMLPTKYLRKVIHGLSAYWPKYSDLNSRKSGGSSL